MTRTSKGYAGDLSQSADHELPKLWEDPSGVRRQTRAASVHRLPLDKRWGKEGERYCHPDRVGSLPLASRDRFQSSGRIGRKFVEPPLRVAQRVDESANPGVWRIQYRSQVSNSASSRASSFCPMSPSALSRSSSPLSLCGRPSALSRSRSGRSRKEPNPKTSRNFFVVT